MPKSRATHITPKQWEDIKGTLYQYWMVEKRPLKSRNSGRDGIIEIMKDRHKFAAT
jgi:hypothetical protein